MHDTGLIFMFYIEMTFVCLLLFKLYTYQGYVIHT